MFIEMLTTHKKLGDMCDYLHKAFIVTHEQIEAYNSLCTEFTDFTIQGNKILADLSGPNAINHLADLAKLKKDFEAYQDKVNNLQKDLL